MRAGWSDFACEGGRCPLHCCNYGNFTYLHKNKNCAKVCKNVRNHKTSWGICRELQYEALVSMRC